MQNTTADLMFNLIFINQIILLSWYYPRTIVNRIETVIDKYPPSQFPKLYLQPLNYYRHRIKVYRDLSTFGLIACLVVILISWNLNNSPNEEMLVFICFALQMTPILILAVTASKHFKLMKKAYTSTSRKANLKPRKLFDFISAKLVAVALLMYFAYVFTYLFIHDFDLFSESKVLITVVGITLMQVYFAAIFYWKMYGKKQNPLSSQSDHIKEIKVVGKIAIYASIAMSTFLMLSASMDKFEYLDALDPLILSLYLQIITIFGIGTEIRSIKIEDVDFDVYKQASQ